MAIEEDEESDDSGLSADELEKRLGAMKAAGNKHFSTNYDDATITPPAEGSCIKRIKSLACSTSSSRSFGIVK